MSGSPTNGWVLKQGEAGYPSVLEDLPDPPPALYGFGDHALLGDGLAVIGARQATPYGLSCARRFARWTANRGIPVVSGAAIGCDLEAHRGALDADGPTVAVLGCGADVDYPLRAATVLASIRRCGVVVSEAPWGGPPTRWTFPRRNRLIAALSRAVLVVEASLPSGTFSTADHALDLGREVLAVPGSIFSPESRGPNRLIRQGATPITDVSDLAHELGEAWSAGPRTLPGTEDRLLACLTADPLRPDDAARVLGTDIVSLIRAIAALEARGWVTRYPDGRYGISVAYARLQSQHLDAEHT